MLLPETANKNLNAKYAVPSLGLQIPQAQAIAIAYVFTPKPDCKPLAEDTTCFGNRTWRNLWC